MVFFPFFYMLCFLIQDDEVFYLLIKLIFNSNQLLLSCFFSFDFLKGNSKINGISIELGQTVVRLVLQPLFWEIEQTTKHSAVVFCQMGSLLNLVRCTDAYILVILKNFFLGDCHSSHSGCHNRHYKQTTGTADGNFSCNAICSEDSYEKGLTVSG